ncbi:hypothetical protein AMATHDRAFT_62499 [Amanita thiersii Skay4041]|uniref:Gti1/Pac2 family-domain-containing protein n=1 Tax=Amanita thiersii Skay4041 TaxID=703135 RepID=A0A2A9NN48_9AGAR|nr:hypothetical protein AMATHDRAFT_62499 [Amanita thiersii Skay4041]
MQQPTCTGLRIRSTSDAHVIFHAVSLKLLPMITRRLDTEERRAVASGNIFVWEERGHNSESTGLGIERWTDSRRWGPSRVKDEFLYYHEREATDPDVISDSDASGQGSIRNLIKQTYSVFVETPRGRRKWHLIAYFTEASRNYLRTIDDIAQLASLHVPPGRYRSARCKGGRLRETDCSYANAFYPPYIDVIWSPPGHAPIYGGSYGQRPLADDWYGHSGGSYGTRRQVLAPLSYLQNIPPLRRHPLDEKALMSFVPSLV